MEKYKKLLVGSVLLFFIFGFFEVKTARAISIDEIKSQIAVMISRIVEIQKTLIDLIAQGKQSTEQKSITLFSPDGGERWEMGKTYDIKWNSSGYPSDSTVQIKLLDKRYEETSKKEMLVANTANTGSYSWKIPELLNNNELLGSLYKVSVSIENNGSTDPSNNYFTITKDGFVLSPYVNIVFPKGGETLEIGKTYTIEWDYPGKEEFRTDIYLTKNYRSYREIAKNIPNVSHYDWTIPYDLLGTGYGIQVNIYDINGNLVAYKSGSHNINVIVISKNTNYLASISEIISNIAEKIKNLVR